MNNTVTLHNATQGHSAIAEVWRVIKPFLVDGQKLQLTVKTEKRRDAQNRLLHAALRDVALQATWAGKKHTDLVWKRLMTAAWLRTKGEHAELIPALDGNGFDVIYEHTSNLTVPECSDLTSYIHAWGAEHGVLFKEPQ